MRNSRIWVSWGRVLMLTATIVGGMTGADRAGAGDSLSFRRGIFLNERTGPKLDLELNAGFMDGKSREVVYDATTGRKISELFWTMDNVPVVGGTAKLRTSDWFSISVSAQTNVAESATMDDYDWLYPNGSWSHWSHHDSTSLNFMYMVDASATLNIYRDQYFTLGLVGGYRRDHFDWIAKGGDYIYSDIANNGFRDIVGSFDAETVGISYEQTFAAAYLGLEASARINALTLNARYVASAWSNAQDRDVHHLRYLLFKEDFNIGDMQQFDIKGKYAVVPGITLTAAYKYLKYDEVKGPTNIIFTPTGQSITVSGDAAGADHVSRSYLLGVDVNLY